MVGKERDTALTGWRSLRALFQERGVDLKRVAVYTRGPPAAPGAHPLNHAEPVPPPVLWQEEFAKSLLAFHNISSLDIGELYWNPQTLEFLSNLKSPQVLRVCLAIDPTSDEKAVTDVSVFDQTHFPNLSRLILLAPSLESALCQTIITSLQCNPSLLSLSFYETEPSSVELHTFLENACSWDLELGTHHEPAPFQQLEELQVERNGSLGPGPRPTLPIHLDLHPFIVGPYTLTPLYSLKHLRRLKIDTARTALLDDNSLRELGKAFLELESLLFMEYGTDASPKVTLVGFLHLLSACPNLSEFALCPDARQLPSYLDRKDFKPHAPEIKLHFFSSPIAHASQLAHFLILHTPALTKLEYFEEEEWVADWYDHSWMKVKMQVAPLLMGSIGIQTLSDEPTVEEVDG